MVPVFLLKKLIPSSGTIVTHSITIKAPSEAIWPWLVQLGSGRAGWYSYDFIDNGGRPSAPQIIPAWQSVAVGDIIPAIPGSKDAFVVRQMIPGELLVLVVPAQTAMEEPDTYKRMQCTPRVAWALMLKKIGPDRTRLISTCRISRNWLAPSPGKRYRSAKPLLIERIYNLLAKMPWSLMAPVALTGHYIMEAKMLRGIKKRAEKLFKQQGRR